MHLYANTDHGLTGGGDNVVRLATIFSPGAVLQRHKPLHIFGDCDQKVTVAFDGQSVEAVCENGRFCAVLPSHEAGEGFTLTVSDGENTVQVENISVGEVFIAAGQSNMEMPLGVTDGAEDELAHCDNPQISFYSIPPRYVKDDPIDMFRFQYMDYGTPTWKVCTADSAKDFSAVGYYAAKRIQRVLGVPVGVIGCNWGCRKIESFIPPWAFDRENSLVEYKNNYESSLSQKSREEYDRGYAAFKAFLQDRIKEFRDPLAVSYGNATFASLCFHNGWKNVKWPQGPYNADRPGCVWNNMLEDTVPYSLRFVLWYQGEGAPEGHYYEKYGVLVDSWREAFRQPDMAFYAIELAPYGEGTGKPSKEENIIWATIREEQRRATLTYARCYLITSMGLGDLNNIHPVHKRELGYRAARSVLYNTYHAGPKSENPYAVSAAFEKDCVRVTFQHDENLVIIGSAVADLYVSADGESFVPAEARIENGQLVVWADGVNNPCEIRYCQGVYYAGQNVFNSAALPASPFYFKKSQAF